MCYSKLNRAINYITTDDGNEIDDMFTISFDKKSSDPNNDIYIITKQGMKYIEDYWRSNRVNRSNKIISITALVLSIISIIISIILRFV